ncbi:MAG: long-chain fatty acid--CoA ligase [Bacteroidetes bacterium]|nr:long-chain fatty acid--CoA ligase [Bacteroidota bacterium]
MNVFDWTSRWAMYKPEAIALEEFETGRKLSWKQLNTLCKYQAAEFSSTHGLKKGDRIAILAENSLELAVLFGMALKTGIILVPLNYRLTPAELDYMLGNCAPSLIVYDQKFEDKVLGCKLTPGKKLLMETLAQKNDRFLALGEEPNFENAGLHGDDPVFLIYTSGTTAFPKGSIYTHQMLLWNSINTQLRLDLTSEDRSLNCAPSFHTGSWNVLMTPFWHHGAYTLFMRKFEAADVLQALENYHMTIWWAVPTMLKMLAEESAFEQCQLEKLRYFVVGGEAMPIPLIELWHRKGILIRQGYGLTEVGPNVTSLSHEDAIRKQGSIGKPNFYYQIRIVDEHGNDQPANVPGELWLKGPTVTPGYWNNPEATAEAIADGWFKTGDLVKADDEGYLYVVDRIKNMYISGAENVYPAEVEHRLRQHPAVEEVAIIGVPDEKWGEAGMAFVKLKDGSTADENELRTFALQHLAKYKVPKHVIFVSALPKTDSGKTDRKQLRNLTKTIIDNSTNH